MWDDTWNDSLMHVIYLVQNSHEQKAVLNADMAQGFQFWVIQRNFVWGLYSHKLTCLVPTSIFFPLEKE